ncbi:TIGR01440 family protein [Geomicrobium sediminis]|uniref:UPF0340 protein JOD17_000532 n=1 Tax=Geomicrobium sediminis TaxID=1347788 RepID=A0ABS2P8I7_9BACL|nr:TIGR01440 family protein [Geomicrobium sediminis]MBM7631441.1 uncharacterized protein (TIGR01440 family) [Geomicrobium sediminis]
MTITSEVRDLLAELNDQASLQGGDVLVIGASTSEIAGKHIGTEGSEEIAKAIVEAVEQICSETGVIPAYQGCEHINRALVVPRSFANAHHLPIVNVIPVRHAGGAMAAYAYSEGQERVIVEHIAADAGVDIGLTLIGMHLKHVAVPVRPSNPKVGQAIVTMARTRPKYIGGPRSHYSNS